MTGRIRADARPKSAVGFMVVFGGIIVACVLLYYGFLAVDRWGLSDTTGEAVVRAKSFKEAGTTYQMQKVGNRMLTVPQSTPPMYLLDLELNGTTTQAALNKPLYDSINVGDRVIAVYRQRRITGTLQVVTVKR